eukprot:7248431-Pyramimonas_sp.AAC.1
MPRQLVESTCDVDMQRRIELPSRLAESTCVYGPPKSTREIDMQSRHAKSTRAGEPICKVNMESRIAL